MLGKLNSKFTITQWQDFSREIYSFSNDRDFGVMEMLSNIQRFIMRAIKGIRKRDDEKTKYNLMIAMSWYISLMNQLHIDLEEKVWQRFPYLCSYCGSTPCGCKTKKIQTRQKIVIKPSLRPKTLQDFQEMFEKIYPSNTRNLENAGIHLAEEMGELSEAITNYRGSHIEKEFDQVTLESADLFSCFMGVANSLNINITKESTALFNNNCHVCHKSPCQCDYNFVKNFRS